MNYFSIDYKQKIEQNGIVPYHYMDTEIFIDGLIYTYGKKAGRETIEWLCETIHNTGDIPYEMLHGAFSCIVKNGNAIHAFSDNSNMHCLYYSDSMISSSFLKILQHETSLQRQLCFDPDAICEYLTLGNVYLDKTFFKQIHILNSTETASIDQKRIVINKKPVGDIDEPSSVTSISDYFDKVAYSLSDMHVCQALTGGYDSRMIYACLSNKIADHPAISANDTKNTDVKYAKAVANANKEELDIIQVKKPVFSNNLIAALMEKKDGIVPFDLDGDIRLLTFKSQLSEKYNIHLTGDGGVLHKDWEWTQDFPFYRKKKSNADQFYKQRLYYLCIDSHIGEKLKVSLDKQAQRFRTALDGIAKSINTQSYDSWYYRISGNRRTDYNCNPIPGIISYAPLEEIDLVRYSYALPRRKRFFFNSMRETITKENKAIARIKTNYGTNASSEIPYVLVDVFYQTLEYFRKAYRYMGRKLAHKNVLAKSILSWTMENEVRESSVSAKAIQFAQRNGLIKNQLTVDDLSYIEIQRLIHIFYLNRFIVKD